MGDVLVESAVNALLPQKRLTAADSIPNIDSLEGSGNDGGDEYSTLKRYQRHLEYDYLEHPNDTRAGLIICQIHPSTGGVYQG
jgi:26S proteasome regulatory subunit T3